MIKKIVESILSIKWLIAFITILITLGGISFHNPHPSNAETVISDINGDGLVNLQDLKLASPDTSNCAVCADLYADGKVDDVDERKLAKAIEKAKTQAIDLKFDLNNDAQVNNADLNSLNNLKNQPINAGSYGLDKPEHLSWGYKTRTLNIGFYKEVDKQTRDAVLLEFNLTQIDDLGREYIVQVETQTDDLDNLAKQIKVKHPDKIKYAVKDLAGIEFGTNDLFWPQWGAQAIRAEQAWFTETIGVPQVRVAVIDTGFDIYQPDFQGKIIYPFNAFEDSTNVATANWQHGTQVASIIISTINNGIGMAGIAPNVRLIPIADVNGTGNLAQGIRWAIDHGAHVINMSFSISQNDDVDDALSEAVVDHKISLIANTGNDGRTDGVNYPASHDNVAGIGAIGYIEESGNYYVWPDSNRGPGLSFYAPGVNVRALTAGAPTGYAGVIVSGTSFAAPHVAGVAALMASVCNKDSAVYGCAYRTRMLNNIEVIDAWNTLWQTNCFKLDFAHDHVINVRDAQSILFRWSQVPGSPLYNYKYDVNPYPGGDGDIDIADIQFFMGFSEYGMQCPSWHLHP